MYFLVWKCVSQPVLAAEFVNFYKSHSNNTIMKKMDGCFSIDHRDTGYNVSPAFGSIRSQFGIIRVLFVITLL